MMCWVYGNRSGRGWNSVGVFGGGIWVTVGHKACDDVPRLSWGVGVEVGCQGTEGGLALSLRL